MIYTVEQMPDNSMIVTISGRELKRNGYDINGFYADDTRDAFIGRLLTQMVNEGGLILSEDATVSIEALDGDIRMSFAPDVAYFKSQGIQQPVLNKPCTNGNDFQNLMSDCIYGFLSEVMKEMKGKRIAFKVTAENLDSMMEICSALNSHRVKIRKNILYKDSENTYKLIFICPVTCMLTVHAIISEYDPLEISFKISDGLEFAYDDEHSEKFMEDAVIKLSKVLTN